jgi:NAD(P)-dependent dehydrogenase (short-subunit alcohol dehydrogenase family)
LTGVSFDLEGHAAVVIGGTTGIGRAMALGLAQAGADVIASSRRVEQVDIVAAEIEAAGRKTLRLASDVLNRRSIEVLTNATLAAFGTAELSTLLR